MQSNTRTRAQGRVVDVVPIPELGMVARVAVPWSSELPVAMLGYRMNVADAVRPDDIVQVDGVADEMLLDLDSMLVIGATPGPRSITVLR